MWVVIVASKELEIEVVGASRDNRPGGRYYDLPFMRGWHLIERLVVQFGADLPDRFWRGDVDVTGPYGFHGRVCA